MDGAAHDVALARIILIHRLRQAEVGKFQRSMLKFSRRYDVLSREKPLERQDILQENAATLDGEFLTATRRRARGGRSARQIRRLLDAYINEK